MDIYYKVNIEQNTDLVFGAKSYNGIKYLNSYYAIDKPEWGTVISHEDNFVPDYGLFETKFFRQLSNNSNYLLKSFELINYNGLKSNQLLQNVFEIDFGTIALGDSKQIKTDNVFVNNTDKVITVRNIIINDLSGVFEIISPMQNVQVAPGDKLDFIIRYSPTHVGSFESTMKIITDDATFDVSLKSKCQ